MLRKLGSLRLKYCSDLPVTYTPTIYTRIIAHIGTSTNALTTHANAELTVPGIPEGRNPNPNTLAIHT